MNFSDWVNLMLKEFYFSFNLSSLTSGALAWNGDMLSSGSRDRLILQRDARNMSGVERRLIGHRQEVSFQLILIWDLTGNVLLFTINSQLFK